MRNLLLFITLLLLGVFLSSESSHAANISRDCGGDSICQMVFGETDSDNNLSFVCGGGGVHKVVDNNGNPIAASFSVIVFDGNSSSEKGPIQLTANESYRYFTYTKASNAYPIVSEIKFSAVGYETKSYTLNVNGNKPCQTSGGTNVGGIILNRNGSQYGCLVGSDGGGSCTATSTNPTGNYAKLFSSLNACSEECGRYRAVQGQAGGSEITCLREDQIEGTVKISKRVFPTFDQCQAGVAAGGLEFDTGVIDENGAVPTNTPTPTPPPPRPPCADGYESTGEPFTGCKFVNTGLGVALATDPASFIRSIFAILLSLSGGIAILLIIRAGYKLMTSQGDAEKVKEAREVLTSAIVGLLFLIFSLVILEVIGVDILRIPGINR